MLPQKAILKCVFFIDTRGTNVLLHNNLKTQVTAVDNARAACQERKERKVCPACLERMAAQDQEATMDHQAVREIAEKMASLDYREELAQQ